MIYTFGDGYASGHIWPEWPQLLSAVLQQPINNYGHVGAGNEYIFNCAVKAALIARPGDIFIVQWAKTDRFDKIIQDSVWAALHDTDLVYNKINATSFNQTWWSTSASMLPEISNYHDFYIQSAQSENRSILYMISLAHMLQAVGATYLYFSTYSHDYSAHNNYFDLQELKWVSHEGMSQWAQRLNIAGTEVQPPPATHLKYVVDELIPRLGLELSSKIKAELTQIVSQHSFIPYYWDRDKIWEVMQHEISMLFK